MAQLLNELSCYEEELDVRCFQSTTTNEEDDDGFLDAEDLSQNSSIDGNRASEGQTCVKINYEHDIANMDWDSFVPSQISKYDFASLDFTYKFYQVYGKANGFSVQKGKILYSKKNGIELQREYFCSNNGFREDKGIKIGDRKREPRRETRCDCKATFRVHVDIITTRWYATVFNDNHNHELMGPKFVGMLPAHRRMRQGDIIQMNTLMDAGIGPSQIHVAFANQSGGYDNVGFRKVDIYNQIKQQRRKHTTDAMHALQFLQDLSSDESPMYFENMVDEEGRLQRLFWCDGRSQKEYELFCDVLAFDATYGKNKYFLPVVIFSGVNNHNRTTIFATVVVTNKCEDTYVWLLEQFSKAMKGKQPTAIITDGDISMKNAIVRVFPSARHRLCGWHLLKNSISNVKTPNFTAEFERCMLAEYDEEFEQHWEHMVSAFGLQQHTWVNMIYQKRHMWATAYFRGHFFAGFRTTSRCEGLHSELGKFVHTRYNLNDFLQHYHRCLSKIRFRELEDDFASIHGEPVIQTNYAGLERSASRYYTRNVFIMFRKQLLKASSFEVCSSSEALSFIIYKVCKVGHPSKVWQVLFYRYDIEFSCSCMWMESRGLPCEHIIVVLAFQEVEDLPESLVSKRWCRGAKGNINFSGDGFNRWDSQKVARSAVLMELYRAMSDLKSDTINEFNEEREKLVNDIDDCRARKASRQGEQHFSHQSAHDVVRDPICASTKGRGGFSSIRLRKRTKCSICKQSGHNRATCLHRDSQWVMSQLNDDPYEEYPIYTQ